MCLKCNFQIINAINSITICHGQLFGFRSFVSRFHVHATDNLSIITIPGTILNRCFELLLIVNEFFDDGSVSRHLTSFVAEVVL